jgi:hypothetical protein
VAKGHEQDISSIKALQDRLDSQSDANERRISNLEAKLAAVEDARDLMREEHASQSLTLSGEIDDLRAQLQQVFTKLDGQDAMLTDTAGAIRTLCDTTGGFDQKLLDMQTETAARLADVLAVERRFEDLRAQNKQEQADLTVLRNDTLKEQQHVITTLIRDAAEQLGAMKDSAEALIEDTRHHHSIIGSLVDERISVLRAELDTHYRQRINSSLQEYLEHYSAAGAEQIIQAHAAQTSALHLEASVKLALQSMNDKYRGEVDRQLKEVIDHAKAIEENRRLDFPTTDSERVEMMIKELEGSFVMLEGIMRSSITQHRSCPLLPRVEQLEAKADMLEVKTELDHRPRICFAVETQTAIHPPTLGSPIERFQTTVERHLQKELDVAAAEETARVVPLVVDRALALHRQQQQQRIRCTTTEEASSSPPVSPNDPISTSTMSSTHGSSAAVARHPAAAAAAAAAQDFDLKPSAEFVSGTTVVGGFGGSSSVATLKDAKLQKEAAVAKVQDVLHHVQAKFQELTSMDPTTSSRSLLSADAKKRAALIAKQKEVIYQKERQLVDQRNRLWREISDLEEKIATIEGSSKLH